MLERGSDERLGESVSLLSRAGSLNELEAKLFNLVAQKGVANANMLGASLEVKFRRSQELDNSLVVFEDVNWLLNKPSSVMRSIAHSRSEAKDHSRRRFQLQ